MGSANRHDFNNGIATDKHYFLCSPCRNVVRRTSLGNREETELTPLKAATKQRLVKTLLWTLVCVCVCVCVCVYVCNSELYNVVTSCIKESN
jgi:hypothetical protein